MTARPIEDELVDLAAHLDVEDGDDAARRTADGVSTRLRAAGGVTRARWWRRRRTWMPVAVVVALTGLIASPAVGDWFGIRGVEVIQRPTTTTTVPAGASLDLGRPSTVSEATKVLGRPPLVPRALGRPDGVWLDARTAAPFVSFVYDGGATLVSEFDATLTAAPIVTKVLGPDGSVEELRVDDHPAMWIDGVHQVVLRARNGDLVAEALRTASSVLLVEIGDLTVRIETPAGRDEAVRNARSLG
jgi:hypothetical protein